MKGTWLSLFFDKDVKRSTRILLWWDSIMFVWAGLLGVALHQSSQLFLMAVFGVLILAALWVARNEKAQAVAQRASKE